MKDWTKDYGGKNSQKKTIVDLRVENIQSAKKPTTGTQPKVKTVIGRKGN
jgi:hypothetical protein